MGVYLEDHPPASRQFYNPRRARVTGAIVVHTAENATDLVLPDGGAEGVASFISRRSVPGSYHSVVDSDSIVRVGRYEWEMFHEGTGGNRWSLGLSFACQAAQWPTLPERWYVGALRNGAIEAANMALWVESTTGIAVPARRIMPFEYRAGKPGFVGHGELDPGRRSDPGADFPWDEFLANYATEMSGGIVPIPSTPTPTWSLLDHKEVMAMVYELLNLYRPPTTDQEAHKAWIEGLPGSVDAWAKDIATKLRKREDPRPTLDFIEWALANPAEAAKL